MRHDGAVCEFELVAGLPLVRAAVEAVEVWLIVDTGANHTVVTPEAIERLGLATGEADVVGIGLAGSVAEVRVGHADSFRLAGVEFGPLHLPVMPLDHVNAHLADEGGPVADGVLGNDLLRRFRVTLDFPRRTLELSESIPA